MRDLSQTELTTSLNKIRTQLLHLRHPDGHWEGELSQSALSTSTAVIALSVVAAKPFLFANLNTNQEMIQTYIDHGVEWLVKWQNADGGWGDTIKSKSNISTMLLAWSALNVPYNGTFNLSHCVSRAESWIEQRAGGLTIEHIIQILLKKYGNDRTFSVPILSACTLAGRLGPKENAWKQILQLPFELSLFPPSWYAALRLPVVSYALPALIAIGESRHAHAPTSNPILRWIRNKSLRPAQSILKKIQPASGGYLEAIPITSFVVMNMASFLNEPNPVVTDGLKFIFNSIHQDGSWAIDTNLSTWVTTHSIRALDITSQDKIISSDERQYLIQWLLDQQYQHVHPYTNSAPGGWAWTNLPGGVPDADDTSGALLALYDLDRENPAIQNAVKKAVNWLLNLQNSDGGMPTFCRGWGTLPFDRSCSDITAHALNAVLLWRNTLSSQYQKRIDRFCQRAIKFLKKTQNQSGAWTPLWFGNESEPENKNWTYGTSVVISSLVNSGIINNKEIEIMITNGVEWLISSQNDDGGWGGGLHSASSIEETALAVKALNVYWLTQKIRKESLCHSIKQGVFWLKEKIETCDCFDATPIGFYFAELWYYEKLYPYIFTYSALNSFIKTLDSSR